MSAWPRSPLSDCCDVVGGATPRTGVADYWDGDICWVTPKDLSELEGAFISDTPRRITRAGLKSCAAAILPTGSVLFSSRAPIGHVAINTVPMATNQGFKSLVPKPGRVEAKFLFYWLRANRAYLESLGNGATFKEVSKAIVSRVEVPLPPLAEQRRIAEVLDRAEALRAKRRAALAQLDTLTQSIFLDLFGDPVTNPMGWSCEPLRDLVTEFRYGTSEKSQATGRPALRIPNVVGGVVDCTNLKTVPVEAVEFERLRLKDGDVLFVRTNGNPDFVGRCAVFYSAAVSMSGFPSDGFVYASYLIRARPRADRTLPIFIREFMLGPQGRRALRAQSKTSAGQFNINTEGLGSIVVPVPPMVLQREFARRVAAIERLKSAHRASLVQLDALFASLQHRAFRGEL